MTDDAHEAEVAAYNAGWRAARAQMEADPSLLVVAKPKCPTCQGGTVHRVKTSPGARHTVPCPDCDRGYVPMVALPAKVVEEWAAVVRWTLARRKLIDVSPEAVRLAQEPRPCD